MKRRFPIGPVLIGSILVIALLLALRGYNAHQRQLRMEDQRRQMEMKAAREKAESERREAEAAEEEERRRHAKEIEEERARLDAERERTRNEREKRMSAEADEQKRQASERATNKAAYNDAVEKFRGKAFGFLELAPRKEKVLSAKSGEVFLCALSDFGQTGHLFRMIANGSGECEVQLLWGEQTPKEVEYAELKRKIADAGCVMLSATGNVWVSVPGGRKATYPVPVGDEEFCIGDVALQGLLGAVSVLQVKLPKDICRIKLVSNDKKYSSIIGEYSYAAKVGLSVVREKVRKALEKKASRGAAEVLKGVKKKRFRKTVVLYDGPVIKKDAGGVTYVPKEFHYTGAMEKYRDRKNGYDKVADAKRKWKELCEEAKRQEGKEREVMQANDELAADAKARASELSNVDDDEVDQFLSNCKLEVEFGVKDGKK